jgi:hypothetical protein
LASAAAEEADLGRPVRFTAACDLSRQILFSSRASGEPSQDNFQLAETEILKPGPGNGFSASFVRTVE